MSIRNILKACKQLREYLTFADWLTLNGVELIPLCEDWETSHETRVAGKVLKMKLDDLEVAYAKLSSRRALFVTPQLKLIEYFDTNAIVTSGGKPVLRKETLEALFDEDLLVVEDGIVRTRIFLKPNRADFYYEMCKGGREGGSTFYLRDYSDEQLLDILLDQ